MVRLHGVVVAVVLGALPACGDDDSHLGEDGGPPPSCGPCDDGDPCTVDGCVEGACAYSPAPADTPCQDGAFCTVADRCDGMGACVGDVRDCAEGMLCATATCDEEADRCDVTTAPSGTACGPGTCDALGLCEVTETAMIAAPMRHAVPFGMPATSGETVAVGIALPSGTLPVSGLTYVFERSAPDAWTQVELLRGDGPEVDFFGVSIAAGVDRLVIGAPLGGDTTAGRASVVERTGGVWAPTQSLAGSDRRRDGFGFGVALDGDRILVGAPEAEVGPVVDAGRVHVFELVDSRWLESAQLTLADARAADWFGHSLALDGDTVFVSVANRAEVHVFERIADEWRPTSVLRGDAWSVGELRPMAMSGSAALIGGGGATMFVRGSDGWARALQLAVPGADGLGSDVALDGGIALVGAGEADGVGACYVFRRVTGVWRPALRLVASDAVDRLQLGAFVALDGGIVAVAAPGKAAVPASGPGAVYVYDIGWLTD